MFVIAFLPSSKHLLISWLQSPSTLILEPKKIKFVTASTLSLSVCHKVMGADASILVFFILNFKPTFSLSTFTLQWTTFCWNMVHWRNEWETTSGFLPQELHEQYEKAKWYDTGTLASQVGRCPICYWGKAEKQLQKEWRGWAKVEMMPVIDVPHGENPML